MKRLVAVMISASMMFYASQAPATADAPERLYEVPIRSELSSSESTPIPCELAAAADGLCTTQLLNGYMSLSPFKGSDGTPNYIRGLVEPQYDPIPPWLYDPYLSMPGFSPGSTNSIKGAIQGNPDFYWEYRIYSGNGTEKPQYRTKGMFNPSQAIGSCPEDSISQEFLSICDVPNSGQPDIHIPQTNEYAEIFVHNFPVPGSPAILYERFPQFSEPVYEGLDHYASGEVVSLSRTSIRHNSDWVVTIDNEKLSLKGTVHSYSDNSLNCQTSSTFIHSYYAPDAYPEIPSIDIATKTWPNEWTGDVALEDLGITKSGTYIFDIEQYSGCPHVAVNKTFNSLKSGDPNLYEVEMQTLLPQTESTFYATNAIQITIPPATTQDPIQGSSNQPTVDPPAAVAVVQTPTTLLPATAKAKKSLKILAKTSAGLPIKVKVKGSCSVKAKTKTTVKKVGKKKVKTKNVVSYNVKLGKKGKTCTVTQTSAGNGTVPAMNSVSVIKIR
jgi:hypothetical protein